MTSSTSSEESEEMYDALSEELKNIQLVILVTRENIDALNAKFANLQEPPPMYIAEYQELTSKLHELEAKETELMEQINSQQEVEENQLDKQEQSYSESQVFQSHYQNQQQIQMQQLLSRPGYQGNGMVCEKCLLYSNLFYLMFAIFQTDSVNSASNNYGGSRCSTLTRQRKVLLRAHLPYQQRTSVEVVPGVRLCDALFKALKLRQLTHEMCEVRTSENGRLISWYADIASLQVDEIFVKLLDTFPIMTHISHQFIRKTFFSLAFCECCRRLLFSGFYCNQCNFRFHQRCHGKVPTLCQQFPVDSYYQRLLAQNPEKAVGIIHPGRGRAGDFSVG